MCISIRRVAGTTYYLFSVSVQLVSADLMWQAAGLAFIFKEMEMEKSRHTRIRSIDVMTDRI
jgi:hypothetical protein